MFLEKDNIYLKVQHVRILVGNIQNGLEYQQNVKYHVEEIANKGSMLTS